MHYWKEGQAGSTIWLNMILTGPIVRNGTWKINVLTFAQQFSSFLDPEALVADISEHMLALPPGQDLLERLLNEMTSGRPYEWEELEMASKEAGLKRMMRFLMRSSKLPADVRIINDQCSIVKEERDGGGHMKRREFFKRSTPLLAAPFLVKRDECAWSGSGELSL